MIKKVILVSLMVLVFLSSNSLALPAFPGAEGMGASATGARGYSGTPTVVKVTNLNDTGAGSFREAVSGTGKDGRYIVFETSGVIELQSPILIRSSYLTIAGETSPGGICISGEETSIGSADNYNYNNIIVRHIRFRLGSQNCTPNCDEEHALIIWKSDDIIFDHCSFSWGIDETVSVTTYNNDSASNITFSWCIFSEGLTDPAPESNHGYLFLFNGTYASGNSMTMHHNYFISANGRMPQFSGEGLFDFRNNVVHNWDSSQNTMIIPYVSQVMNINYVSNYQKVGSDSNSCASNSYDAQAQSGGGVSGCPDSNPALTPYEMVYMNNNLGCRRTTGLEDDWQLGCGYGGLVMDTDWQSSTPYSTTDIAVTTTTMTESYSEEILLTVGANKCQSGDCRDSQDTANVAEYTNGTASLRADVTYPTDWPTYSTPAAKTDSNSNGIADDWEVSTFGELVSATDDDLGDGYDNIENYFHYLSGYTAPAAPATTSSSSTVLKSVVIK